MNNLLKKLSILILKSALVVIFSVGLYFFCRHQTAGFQVHRILSNLSFHLEWEVTPLSVEEQKKIDDILSQPFYFLGKGAQSYAFISEDKQTVLKFFKHHHMSSYQWVEKIPLPSFLANYRSEIMDGRKKGLHTTFGSFKIAYETLQKETGLLFLHLNKTNHLNKKITIIDKLGIKHVIEADQMEFVLQKKAEMAYPKLEKLIQAKDLATAKACIDSFFDLIIAKSKKGVQDNDPVIERNIAFVGTTCIEIDLGAFYLNEETKDPQNLKNQILMEAEPLKNWLAMREPSLSVYVDNKINSYE